MIKIYEQRGITAQTDTPVAPFVQYPPVLVEIVEAVRINSYPAGVFESLAVLVGVCSNIGSVGDYDRLISPVEPFW